MINLDDPGPLPPRDPDYYALTAEGVAAIEDPPTAAAATYAYNFHGGTIGAVNAAPGSSANITQNIGGDADAVLRLAALTVEMIAALRALLPAEEAEELAAELAPLTDVNAMKENPEAVAERGASIGAKLIAKVNSTGTFVENAEKIGKAVEKFGPWLIAAGDFVARRCSAL